MKIDALSVCDMINLMYDMETSEFLTMVIHSFDVAKISTLMMKRIDPSAELINIYITGLFHDIGLISLAEIKLPGALSKIKSSPSSWGTSFQLDNFLNEIDNDSIHGIISYKILEKMDLLPKEYLYAVLNHHVPLGELDGSEREILLTNIINVSDIVSRTLRENVEGNLSESLIALEKVVDDYPMVKDVRKALKDIIISPLEFGYILDDKPHNEKFFKCNVEIDIQKYMEFLKAAVLMVDLRSPFTVRHTSGVAKLSKNLAEELLKTDFDGDMMYISGLMHDMGKIKAPLDILHKPSKLNKYEYLAMKLHAVETYKMFSKYPKFAEFTAIASLHHERLDGSGYPWGLKARDLSMRARILQVADVFTALTEERPYRGRLSSSEAIRIIEDMVNKGKLDSVVFETLRSMVKNGFKLKLSDIVIMDFFEEMENIEEIKEILHLNSH
ncbi:HD domain-containing phosphohydrolase [Mesoaciditoga sp.]